MTLRLLIGVLTAVVLAGCGGSDDGPIPVSQLTTAGVMKCIRDGGGEPWGLVPTEPRNAPPIPEEHVYTIGPDRGHIAVLLGLQPADTKKLAKGIGEIGEYVAYPARGGRVLLLLDDIMSKVDRSLAFRCVGAAR